LPQERHQPLRHRQNEAQAQAQRKTAERDLVGQNVVLNIGEDEDQHHRTEERGLDRKLVEPEARDETGVEQTIQPFHERIAPRDRARAVAATAAQQEVAQQRHIIPGADLAVAVRAMGARLDDGFLARPTMDTNVEEAADQEPK
jgi:hypothetical protein